ncbi:MAG: efflux RND transporter periplasmic adaptor subunit [Rheinheimera sp.]|nr:efflux RND transporter periplasmic adaptor subunit [Rheinheimera sp.]
MLLRDRRLTLSQHVALTITALITLVVTATRLQATESMPEAAVPVSASQSRTQPYDTIQEFTGSFRPVLHSQLSAAQPGLVRQVLVEAGQQVRQGQVLVALDDSVARQQQAAAKAALALAEAQWHEQQRLVGEAQQIAKDAMLPATELRKRQAALQQAGAEKTRAEALLAAASVALAQHQISAPFAGVVTERTAMPGNWQQPGQPLLELVSLEKLWLDVEIPQQYYPQIACLSQAEVVADMAPSQVLQLPLTARIPLGRADSRAFRIRLSYLQSPQTQILPGTSAQVRFVLSTEPLTSVPQSALLRQPDGAWSVFVVPASSKAGDSVLASRQPVELVSRHQGQAMVRGLNDQPLVLTAGHQQLKPQQQVRLVELQSTVLQAKSGD